jgi:oxygen-dependent protoporphyrinogen oxidase
LFVSFDEGMQVLVDALVARLPSGTVTFGARVTRLERLDSPTPERPNARTPERPNALPGWRVHLYSGDTLEADSVCIALPAYRAAGLVEAVDPVLAARLLAIPYASSATVNLAYRRADVPHPLDGFGFVVPAREGRAILGCTFSGVKFPGRAPQGHALLRAFLGEPYATELADDTVEAAVREDLRLLLGIRSAPLWTTVSRHPNAMAQYPVGHLDHVAEIEARVAQIPGLTLAGNAYRGIGIPDCIRGGEAAAEGIIASLLDHRA